MRGARLILACSVLALVVPASGAQARRHHHRRPPACSLKGSHVIDHSPNKSIRILARIQPADDSHDYDRQTVYGCMPRYNRVVVLNDKSVSRLIETGNNDQYRGFISKGSLVAYWFEDRTHSNDQVGENWDRIDVYVKSLRTGKTLHFDHANGLNIELGKFELKPNGSMAYTIDQPAGLTRPFPRQVRKMDLYGNTVLDSQPGIDPASLTLSGSTVTWKRNSATITAALN